MNNSNLSHEKTKMNLDYKIDNNRFNARVSSIIYNKDKTKILLFKMKDRDFYMLPGGRIEMNEDSLSAVKREISEELGFDLEFTLCSIQENFLKLKNANIMQYCFCYKTIYDGKINDEKFVCKDNNNQVFEWVDLNKLSNIIIKPSSTCKLIQDDRNDIKHIIEFE